MHTPEVPARLAGWHKPTHALHPPLLDMATELNAHLQHPCSSDALLPLLLAFARATRTACAITTLLHQGRKVLNLIAPNSHSDNLPIKMPIIIEMPIKVKNSTL